MGKMIKTQYCPEFWADKKNNDSKPEIIKCPECLQPTTKEELDMFGGVCEECSGAFDNK